MPEYVQYVPDAQIDRLYSKPQQRDLAWRALEDARIIMALPTADEREAAYDKLFRVRPYMYEQRALMQAMISLALENGIKR